MLNKFTFWRKWIKSNIDWLGQYTPADEYFVFPQGPSWPWISYNIMANEYVSPFWVPWGWVFFDLSSSGAVHNNSGFQNKQSNKQNTKLSSISWDAPLNEYKLTEVFFLNRALVNKNSSKYFHSSNACNNEIAYHHNNFRFLVWGCCLCWPAAEVQNPQSAGPIGCQLDM